MNVTDLVEFWIVVALICLEVWRNPLWLESEFATNKRVIHVTVGPLKRLHHEQVSQISASPEDQIKFKSYLAAKRCFSFL